MEQEDRAAEDFTTGSDAHQCQTALPRSTSREVHQRQVLTILQRGKIIAWKYGFINNYSHVFPLKIKVDHLSLFISQALICKCCSPYLTSLVALFKRELRILWQIEGGCAGGGGKGASIAFSRLMLNRARIEAEYRIGTLKRENPSVLQMKIVNIYLEFFQTAEKHVFHIVSGFLAGILLWCRPLAGKRFKAGGLNKQQEWMCMTAWMRNDSGDTGRAGRQSKVAGLLHSIVVYLISALSFSLPLYRGCCPYGRRSNSQTE